MYDRPSFELSKPSNPRSDCPHFFFSSCFPWFGLFCIEVHSDWMPKGYAVHYMLISVHPKEIGLFMTNIALCFSEKYAVCGVKCVVCCRFSMSYAVFRLLCIFFWVKFVLCRSPRLYLCFTSQFDPDGFRQPHQQPVIALSANCTYHPQDISNTHAPQHTSRDLKNTCWHTHTQNYDRMSSFIIHIGPNHSMLPSFHKMPITECPRLRLLHGAPAIPS